MKKFKKMMSTFLLTAILASLFSISVFADVPTISNISVSSNVTGKNVIKIADEWNRSRFVTNSSIVRIQLELKYNTGSVVSPRIAFYGETPMGGIPLERVPNTNLYYVDWAIPNIALPAKDCRLVIYCTNSQTNLEDRIDKFIDIKYSTCNVIAETMTSNVSDFSGFDTVSLTSILYDLTFSGLRNTVFKVCHTGSYTVCSYPARSISNLGNYTYRIEGEFKDTSPWNYYPGEYFVNMQTNTNNSSTNVRIPTIKDLYYNYTNYEPVMPVVFENSNQTGNKAYVERPYPQYESGNYISDDLRYKYIQPNSISFIIVPKGYTITVFDGDFFMGPCLILGEGIHNLEGTEWDNRIDSLKVVKI